MFLEGQVNWMWVLGAVAAVGWIVGLVALWFAVRNTATDDVATPYLKDASFIRKRLQATSTFEYSKATEGTSTTLSSKKKNPPLK